MLYIERVLWALTTVMLLASGCYFTIKLRCVQFKLKDMIMSLKEKCKGVGVSPFQSLMITLGARIGVGSLAGIALAIYYGGIGTIFWIWISTIICAVNAFSESLLGVKYRQMDNNSYIGGPPYYIEKGMKNKLLGKIYATVLVFAYVVGFLTVQSNTMVKSITEIYNINPLVIAIIISLLTMLIIIKGIKRIANFSAKLVPFMVIAYIVICCHIIFNNIDRLYEVVSSIVYQAFNPTSMGIGIILPIIIGFQRGTFANESGLGTGAIASAVADTNSPVKQGFIQMLGIYIETLILSSVTAFVIIMSNYDNMSSTNVNGIELTQRAFSYHLGSIGNYVIMIAILLFAFSTIITGYYYGEASLKFLFQKISNRFLFIFKCLVVILLLIGGIASSTFIWSLADIFVVFLGLINISSLFSLRKEIVNEYRNYKYMKK